MKKIAFSIAAALTVGACVSGNAAPQNAKTNTNEKQQIQQKIMRIQSKIASLNHQLNEQQAARVNKAHGGQLVKNSSRMGRLSHASNTGYLTNMFSRDSAGPLELIPSTTHVLGLLKAKPHYADYGAVVGGYFEHDIMYWTTTRGLATSVTSKSTKFTSESGSDVVATTISFDIMGNLGPWITTFASYKNANVGTASEAGEVNKAEVILGNLKKLPIFVAVGKDHLPFGVFAGNGPWSVALPRAYFRSSEVNQIQFGYYKDGLNTYLSFFNSDIKSNIADFVYSLYYNHTINHDWSYQVGAGYVNDARGMKGSGYADAYSGAAPALSKTGDGNIPAVDMNAQVGYKDFTFNGEYITTLRGSTVASSNEEISRGNTATGNTNGKAKSWLLAGTWAPKDLWGKPMTFGVSYSGSTGLANVPVGLANNPAGSPNAISGIKRVWILSAAREQWKDVYFGLEYQRAVTFQRRKGNVFTLDTSIFF